MAVVMIYHSRDPSRVCISLAACIIVVALLSVLSQAVAQSTTPPLTKTATTKRTVDPEGTKASTDSPSPAAPESEQGQDLILLPPSLVKVPTGRPDYYRSLKTLANRKRPLSEDFLDDSKKRVLETAVQTFGLLYSMFPVKRGSNLEMQEELDNESDQVRAFELLSGIVGRAVRDAIICSSDNQNSTARKRINCDKPESTVIRFGQEGISGEDPLCSENDPESALSEECKKTHKRSKKMRIVRGPSLDFTLKVQSTSRPGHSVRLPPNGRLRDAIDLQIWKAASPTKFILILAPYEFIKDSDYIEKMNRKIVSAFTKKYGSNENHNIVTLECPSIYNKKITITQLALRYLPTAKRLARIVLRWHKMTQLQLSEVHFIGASLGAHLAGVIGKIIKAKTEGEEVARITGLDPIGWGFDEMDGIGVDSDMDLSKDDASFVDVIHTSSPDPNFPFIHYGSNEKRGTVDFYPNNGRAQYCSKTDGLCHHFYSVVLYAASILGTNFNACKCSSWDDFTIRRECSPCAESAKMGEPVDQGKTSGVYYLSTA